MLKPQDALTACKVFSLGEEPWSYLLLAGSLFLSQGEAHLSVARCLDMGVLARDRRNRKKILVVRRRLHDLCAVVLPMLCRPVRGAVVRGVPTSVRAPCLAGRFPTTAPPVTPPTVMVWPHDSGEVVLGESLLPVYPTVPRAVRSDARLYELLALVDVVRVGSPSERRVAVEYLKETIVGDGRMRP